jgi:hypothetical protein
MRSLRDRLEGGAGIPAEELLRHLRAAAEALDALHEQGRRLWPTHKAATGKSSLKNANRARPSAAPDAVPSSYRAVRPLRW